MDPQQPHYAQGEIYANDPPPTYSKTGYAPLPQGDPYKAASYYGTGYGPPGATHQLQGYPGYPVQPTGYAPAPPVMPQQSCVNTNVVVVGQPTAPAQTTIIHPPPRANAYLVLTLVLCALCFIHGNVLALVLLIPALICSLVASNHNNAGNYTSAKQCGELALCCNICVIIKYVLLVVAAVTIGILFATGVLTAATFTGYHCTQQCDDYYYHINCRTVCY